MRELRNFPEFGETFADVLIHPETGHEIPLKLIGRNDDGSGEMWWAVYAGTHFPPETHHFGHTLKIRSGEGIVNWNGQRHPYKPGSKFEIGPGEPHGLEAATNTVVEQHDWPKDYSKIKAAIAAELKNVA